MVAVQAEDDEDVLAMADAHADEVADKPKQDKAVEPKYETLRIEVLTVCTVDGVTYTDVPCKVAVTDSAEVRALLAAGFARLLDKNEKVDGWQTRTLLGSTPWEPAGMPEDGAVRPSMSPDVLDWRRKYEIAIENGSFRTMPSVKEQFDAVREELGSSQL